MSELLDAPGADPVGDDLRCSPWTAAQGVDPVGSAGTYDRFLLVEAPLPWPRDVSGIPVLAAAAAADPRTRVLAVVPGAGGSLESVAVTDWRRETANHFGGTDHRVPPDGVEALLADLVAHPDAAHPTAVGPAPPELLVCGHGKRDRCCGRWGTLLQTELAASLPALCGIDGVRVRRCSHTGGHRFAPTGVSLPDGRLWAHLDVDLAAGVMARTAAPTALRSHYRGSCALDMWGQAVERTLFEEIGWAWLAHDLTAVTTEVADDRRSANVALEWAGPDGAGIVTADVVVRRDVPVLVCGEPPEAAKGTSPELEIRSIVGLSRR